jgi:hypothetical protein
MISEVRWKGWICAILRQQRLMMRWMTRGIWVCDLVDWRLSPRPLVLCARACADIQCSIQHSRVHHWIRAPIPMHIHIRMLSRRAWPVITPTIITSQIWTTCSKQRQGWMTQMMRMMAMVRPYCPRYRTALMNRNTRRDVVEARSWPSGPAWWFHICR